MAHSHIVCTSNMSTVTGLEELKLLHEAHKLKYPDELMGVDVWAKCTRANKTKLLDEVTRGEREACKRHENRHK